MIKAFLALICIAALPGAAAAQTLPELQETPASVRADLSTQGTLDIVRLWPLDWNGDAAPDLLVQAAFVLGGNAVYLRHRIYLADGTGYRPDAELDLAGGVRSVTLVPGGYEVSLYVLRDGDARCCPSGERRVIISP